jgi:hypothetical protein
MSATDAATAHQETLEGQINLAKRSTGAVSKKTAKQKVDSVAAIAA